MQLADYSGGRPSGAALKAAGFGGVIRYVGLGSAGKRITAAEYRDLVGAGVKVLLVAELGTTDAWGGYNAGYVNAHAALSDARALGIPDSVPIAAAADSHAANQSQINAAVDYARAFRDVLGFRRAGFYGFSETSRAVHAAGVVSWHWRCGSIPSGGDESWVNFWQRNAAPTTRVVSGVVCDINEQYHSITEDDVNLTDPITAYNANGTPFQTTVGDVLARIPAVLQCVRPGNGWSVTDGWLSGAFSNANTRIPAIQAALEKIGSNLDAYEAADASRDAQLSAAVAAVQVGDVQGLAEALIPLLPKSATPDDVTDAIRAAFAKAAQ